MNKMLTPKEAAAVLNITEGELRDLRYRNRVAFVKVGYRTVRYALQDLEAFLKRYRVAAAGEGVEPSAPLLASAPC